MPTRTSFTHHLFAGYQAPEIANGGPLRPVLVAIDGSGNSWRALEWAATHALATGAPLRIVHAFWSGVFFDPYGYAIGWDERSVEFARHLLDAATARVKYTNPGLDVTSRLLATNAVPGILNDSRDAGLIVLGQSRARSRLAHRFWSVSSKVARRAPGRVVLVDTHDEVLV